MYLCGGEKRRKEELSERSGDEAWRKQGLVTCVEGKWSWIIEESNDLLGTRQNKRAKWADKKVKWADKWKEKGDERKLVEIEKISS